MLKLILPHAQNNNRAKLRTSKGIVWLAIVALLLPGIIKTAPTTENVLGYATAISDTEIVNFTNDQRLKHGVLPVKQDAQLNQAAFMKGQDMFKNQYWAHVSQTGVQPWGFITSSGYVYAYAGENLARDFGDSRSVVEAWMDSPTHKENILNSHYKDIGVAVVNGVLDGVETTLVIQEFGQRRSEINTLTINDSNKNKITNDASSSGTTKSLPVAQIKLSPTPLLEDEDELIPTPAMLGTTNNEVISSTNDFKVSPINLTQAWSLSIAMLMILVFALDWWLVSHKKLPRLIGKSWAHIMVLITVMAALMSTTPGLIR